MLKKKDQGEETLKFALKIVAPLFILFAGALVVDISHAMDWADAGGLDDTSYAVSDFFNSIF
jgi:hypothetical protein